MIRAHTLVRTKALAHIYTHNIHTATHTHTGHTYIHTQVDIYTLTELHNVRTDTYRYTQTHTTRPRISTRHTHSVASALTYMYTLREMLTPKANIL